MGHSGVNSLTRCNLFCHPRGWSPLLSEIIIVYPSLYAIRLDLILSNL